jgi:hypothetical protein
MRPRLAAAGVALGWIAASSLLLFVFRGAPLRLRGLLVLGSLLVLIVVITWLRRRRRG